MKILIVGAGAAGMMAAATIVETNCDAEVCIVEKNAVLGRKVIISGGGRCNLTTAENDIPELMKAYPRGSRWLRFVMHEFSPSAVYEWFEKHGIPLKTEGRKIFPKSNQGTDVTGMFQKIFEAQNVEVLLKTAVVSIQKADSGFKATFDGDKETFCDKLILTTGGHAYRHTGSTGDGYAFVQALGHSINTLAATLNSFSVSEDWIADLAGVSIANAKFKVLGKEISGAFLFTHKGISGPGVFALSSLVAFEECSPNNPLPLSIDFLPELDYQKLTDKIQGNISENPKKAISGIVHGYLPKSVLAVMFKILGIDAAKSAAEVAKKDVTRLVEALKNFKMTLIERSAGAEIVTAGGVDLNEVDQKTMESKICPGLYFGGELLDVDGFTGGYNLQIAWATGRAAGLSALGEVV